MEMEGERGSLDLPGACSAGPLTPPDRPGRWALASIPYRKEAEAAANGWPRGWVQKGGGGRSLWELPLWLGRCTCSLSSPVIPHNLAVGTTDLMFADEAPGTQGGQEQVASEQRPQLCLPPNSILFLTGPIGR